MRTINAQPEPVAYEQWRAASQGDINYGYDLIPSDVRRVLKDALIAEQGGLCAYTGIAIDLDRSHIEHMIPQAHCVRGVGDLAYRNLVACYPGADAAYVPFGAVYKANWPPPEEQHLFVTPRLAGCDARFRFNLRGEISVEDNDEAARVTVERLGLNNTRLEGMRREAIRATLQWHGKKVPLLDLAAARKRLTSLEQAENEAGPLEPFCFALKQALRKHVARLEHIRESKRKGQR